jgi:PKD repeat protein
VTFTVTDPHGASDTMQVALKAINAAPMVDAGADQVVGLQDVDDHDKHDKDKPEADVSIAAVFDDLGLRDTHTARINWGDGSATTAGKVIEPTATTDGTVTGKHTYTKAGTYTVTVTVKDDDGGVRSDTLLVTVKKPVEKKNFEANEDQYKLDEDTVLRVSVANGVLANDRTPAGATLQARVVEGPEHGRLLFQADGSFVYVPERDFHGTDSFWYEFTDGNNVSKAVEVALKVKDVKDHPASCHVDWDSCWKSGWDDGFLPFGKKHWC